MDRRISSVSKPRRRLAIGALLLAVAALGYGCFERSLKPVNPCTTSVQGEIIQVTNVDKVDLLMMIDNSNSMSEEQASVVTEVPRIVQILTSGDRDGDGMQDFMPARSLHIGLVTSDMGLGTVTGITSCDPGFGDDGLMQFRPRHGTGSCQTDYTASYLSTPNVFEFDPSTHAGQTPASFAADVTCVATFGTDGCGFEFELESPLKAISLTPTDTGASPVSWTRSTYRPPVFYANTFGHGSDPATNGAFLRPDSALAIITINDEDDCSTGNFDIFSMGNPAYTGDLNLRCYNYADQLYDLTRYSEGFLGLRQNPGLLIYGAITGVPVDLAGMSPDVILADSRMHTQPDPANPLHALATACVSPGGRGVAYPAERMTRLAQLLEAGGAHTTIQSICNTNFTAAFDQIIQIISAALQGACLGRSLNPDADGNVDCDVLEVLAPIGSSAEYEHCADLPNPEAYELVTTEMTPQADGSVLSREVCRVHQVGRAGAGVDPGWAYDDGSIPGWSSLPAMCTQRIGFSVVSPINGAEVRLQCNETILPSTAAAAQLGTPCDPATGNTTVGTMAACSVGRAVPGNPMPLACDRYDRSCQIACTSDADCTAAGLLSYVCDHRTATQYFTAGVPAGIDMASTHDFCVNPTCGSQAAVAN